MMRLDQAILGKLGKVRLQSCAVLGFDPLICAVPPLAVGTIWNGRAMELVFRQLGAGALTPSVDTGMDCFNP